jgi:DNA-binding IclR family transcriptional regulator
LSKWQVDDPGFATTLAKGLAVLRAFRTGKRRMSNAEIAAEIGVTRPTAARLTYTLVKLGYLKSEKSKYRLAWRVASLASPLLLNMHLLHVARPSMERLAQDVGGTVSIGVIDNLGFLYIETARANENIWHTPDLGTIGPLVSATIGQALCSLLDDDELADIEQRMMRRSPESWEQFGERFRLGVRSCRERGYSVLKGDWIPETHSVGVPLFRDRDGECFAINCRVPIFRLRGNQIEEEVAPRLKSLASSIRAQYLGSEAANTAR